MKLFRKTPDDLKTALGQCFWIGLNGTTIDDPFTKEIFKTFQPGGIILFQRNVESLDQVRKLNDALQEKSSVPLLIAVDQEGGTVERLHELITSIPPAMALAAARSGRLIRLLHGAHARLLRSLGFNVNFNPVLDLALARADNGLGTRCFSDDPRMVARCARDILDAYQKAGLLSCGKHFPGLGDTDRDSHIDLPIVKRPWKQIRRHDLFPYRKLLRQLPFIMVNHALYPDINKKMPASLAPEVVTDFLLTNWNYAGLSISDDLIMGAVSNLYNLPEAAEKALLAGNHMILICKPEGVVKAYDRLLTRAMRNSDLAGAIYHNSSRVLSFKFRFVSGNSVQSSIGREKKILEKCSDKISDRAITWLSGKEIGAVPKHCTLFLPRTKWIKEGNPNALSTHFESHGCDVSEHFFSLNITEAEGRSLAEKSKTDWNIIIFVNAFHNAGQVALAQQLKKQGKKVAVLCGGFPLEPVPEDVEATLAIYWTSPSALKAAAKVLLGERRARGKLPLHMS